MRTLSSELDSALADRDASGGTPGGPGSRIWGAIGIITIIAIGVPIAWAIGGAGSSPAAQFSHAVPTRTVTITQPVTSLSVESYGAPIQVTARPVHQVTVIEAISYNQGGTAPTVTDAVSHGRLTLAAPACATSGCSVRFTVTVPEGVAVTAASDGGLLTVAGVAGANLDSGGGIRVQVPTSPNASHSVTVNTGGGPVTIEP